MADTCGCETKHITKPKRREFWLWNRLRADSGVHVACQLPLLLTWFNFKPSVDKYSHAQQSVEWNYFSIPKLQRLHRWSLGIDK